MGETIHNVGEYNPKEHDGLSYPEYNLTQSYKTLEERMSLIMSWAGYLEITNTYVYNKFFCHVRQFVTIQGDVSDLSLVRLYRIYLEAASEERS